MRSADDAGVLAAIESAARAEAAAAAQRLAAVAELARRRCGDAERALWACDSWDAAAAEVSAALNISRGQASGQMHLGLTLFRRLPRVAELFAQGVLGLRVVSAIADRTALVGDDDVLAAVDEAMAEHASTWGPLSAYKLEQAIDLWVDRLDPGAVRRTPEEPSPDRGRQMPQRRSTRQVESARRIKRERTLNDVRVAERNRPPPF